MRVGFVLFAYILLTTTAIAAPKIKMTKVDQKTYVDTWSKANESYKLQEYEQAIVGYKEAYRLSNDPDILLNMGRCYQKMKRYEDSLSSYRLYLKEEPTSPYKAELEAEVIAKLEELMKQGSMLVKVDQGEAQIYLGGNKKGAAPQEIKELAPGKYVLEVTKEGYEANSQEVTLNPNQVLVVEVVLVPLPGTIDIKTDQDPADVMLDGVMQENKSPLTLEKLPAGEHVILISKTGFKKKEFKIDLPLDGKETINASLEIARGTVEVLANVQDAEILLNGQKVGNSSKTGVLVLKNVPVGEYEVIVRKKSFREGTGAFVLNEDQVQPVEIILSGSPLPKIVLGLGASFGVTSAALGGRSLLLWRDAQEAHNEGLLQTPEQADAAQAKFDQAISVARFADVAALTTVVTLGVGYALHIRAKNKTASQEAKQ